MRCAVRMRLDLIPMKFMRNANCDCGKSFPYLTNASHLHTCNSIKGTGFSNRHDLIKIGLAKVFRNLGASVIIEPTGREPVPDSSPTKISKPKRSRRADLLIIHSEHTAFIDISVTHPTINKNSKGKNPLASREQLVAARRVELHKEKIYADNGAYNDFPVVPAILETFGGFGPEFTKLLHLVSKFDAFHTPQAAYDRLVSRIAVLLVKGNHALELSGVPRTIRASFGVSDDVSYN
jgi:hypothetical protein